MINLKPGGGGEERKNRGVGYSVSVIEVVNLSERCNKLRIGDSWEAYPGK